jgi:type VI secretion system protein VasJ
MQFQGSEIVNLGVDPISAAMPAGDSVRYDPEFEQIAAEIAKIESVTAAAIDWDLVAQLSISILKTKSKDYRVAGYLAAALFQTGKFEGLIHGIRLYEKLIRNFWETGFPEKSRMRGRIGALEWLSTRMGIMLSRDTKSAVSDEIILELEKSVQSLLSTLAEFLGNDTPSFSDFQSAVDSRARDVRSRISNTERAKEEEIRRAAAVASGEITEIADAEKVTEECRKKLARVSGFLYQSDPTDPLAYCISRSITWGWIVALPTNENGVTYIPPIPAGCIQRCNTFAGSGNWQGVVDEAESEFFDGVFGFDLQRWCIRALKELGEPYVGARQAILAELSGLFKRLPELIELRFSDGSPFADTQTKSWIKNEVLQASFPDGAPEQGGEKTAELESSELADAAAKAGRLVAEGKLQEAIRLFREGIARTPSSRLRFLWRLRLAKFCMDAGKLQLALPQLVSLDEDIIRFSLEEWEPDLSLEVVQQLYVCRQKLAAGLQDRPLDGERQLAQLYQRLCKLDVNAALAVEP